MRILINEKRNINNKVIVGGTTDIGFIKGIWKSMKEPIIGEVYSAELNIDEIPKGQVSTISNKMEQPKVYIDGEYVCFIGKCEDIEDIYYIRFANDWLEMIEINDNDIIKKGDYISFKQVYTFIWIYPYEI